MITILNFYRNAIKQNRDIMKSKEKIGTVMKAREMAGPIDGDRESAPMPFDDNSFLQSEFCSIKERSSDQCYVEPKEKPEWSIDHMNMDDANNAANHTLAQNGLAGCSLVPTPRQPLLHVNPLRTRRNINNTSNRS